MTFPINVTVPNGPNVPANDVPPMRTNFQNISGFLGVDHTAPGAFDAGTHQQVTFLNVTAQGAQPLGESVLYTFAGIAAPTQPNLIFQNQNVTVPVNLIKAWAFVIAGVGPTFAQNSNVSTVVRPSQGLYNITLVANAVASANFGVIVSTTSVTGSLQGVVTYAITGTGTFTLSFRNPVGGALQDPTNFSFIVLQV